jgi:hypothetical protein
MRLSELSRRDIHLIHLGRGHTRGDVVVYLLKEQIVCTGDFYNGYIGYLGDAYVDEWIDSRRARKTGSTLAGKTNAEPANYCMPVVVAFLSSYCITHRG